MYKVDCIRVTHPCAGLKHRSVLPLDLHVLGLPLAFILSQDQTLHRIILILLIKFTKLNATKKSYSLLNLQSKYKYLNRAVNPICL